MLCELTACARFATLFWGVFDSASGTLRYVNAGHAAPMLIRHGQNRIERLDQGGPVLGLLPSARYSAGSVKIEAPIRSSFTPMVSMRRRTRMRKSSEKIASRK